MTPFGALAALIQVALFTTGLILALVLLGRGDRRAALLVALGFGCEIAVVLIWAAGAILVSVGGVAGAVALIVNVLSRLIGTAGYALVLAGLLRRMRALRAARQGAASPGVRS